MDLYSEVMTLNNTLRISASILGIQYRNGKELIFSQNLNIFLQLVLL